MNPAALWNGNLGRGLRAVRFAVFVGVLLLALSSLSLHAKETNSSNGAVAKNGDADTSTDTLRSYLQLQEQIHAAMLAIERNRKDAEETAARQAESVSVQLQLIQQTLSSQRGKELEAIADANRLLLIAAGCFAVVGLLAMVLTAYLQWRAVNRLAEMSASTWARPPGAGRALPAMSASEAYPVGRNAAEQSSTRLVGALGQLEKRILALEHTTQPPTSASAVAAEESRPTPAPNPPEPAPAETASDGNGDSVNLLLAKGQSLLSMDEPEKAAACFDEILALMPNHTEALVKKGAALERLRQNEEALRCYDRAIAADESLTIAYLHKGGLYNRLERYNEALACYEQALRTQEKRRAN